MTMAPEHQNSAEHDDASQPAPISSSAALRAKYPWAHPGVDMELPTYGDKRRSEGAPLWRLEYPEDTDAQPAR